MCKYEHYGNCDPETKDQEYCIFHKPDKTEDEAREFYRKFLRKFKPRKEKIRVGLSEIERFVFESEVDCSGYIFPEIPKSVKFTFIYSLFKKNAKFMEAIFEGNAWFMGTTFEGVAGFREAIFKKEAGFFQAIFNEIAVFGGAVFEGNANFGGAIFKKIAGFNMAILKKDVNFLGAIFEEITWFDRTIFEKNVNFSRATFNGLIVFKGETEKDICNSTEEKYKFYKKLYFYFITFRTINIDLPSECFKHPQAEAEACRVQRICYEREGKRDDADRMFVRERRALRKLRKLEARNVLELIRDLHRNKGLNLNWKTLREKLQEEDLNPKWINKWMKESEEEITSYEYLKLLARAAWDVFAAYTGSAIEYALADFTCRYGTDWKRPVILWIALVIFVFPFIYCSTHSISGIHGAGVDSIWNCLYFSVVTATTLGYGDLHPVGWGKAIASAEAIFGMFMWAVFLAVFSRKYMR